MTINGNVNLIFRKPHSRVLHRVPGACDRCFSNISTPRTNKNEDQIPCIFKVNK